MSVRLSSAARRAGRPERPEVTKRWSIYLRVRTKYSADWVLLSPSKRWTVLNNQYFVPLQGFEIQPFISIEKVKSCASAMQVKVASLAEDLPELICDRVFLCYCSKFLTHDSFYAVIWNWPQRRGHLSARCLNSEIYKLHVSRGMMIFYYDTSCCCMRC